MSISVLQNTEQDAFLEREGYVVVPFLNKAEVSILKETYLQNHPETKEGLYATAHSSSFEFKKKISDKILFEFQRALGETFFECRPLGGSYIVKYKGERGILFPHQDWNIVDEDIYRSFNIWVPLVDTSETNGALAVLPGSHKFVKSYRGVNIDDPFQKVSGYTWKNHTTVSMKAGEALIYDHRLLHASAVNETDEPRLAVVFGIIPDKADMRLYYMNDGVVGEYENSVDFFMTKNILEGPQGLKKLRDIDYKVEYLTEVEFDRLINDGAVINQVEMNMPEMPTESKTADSSTSLTFFQRVKNMLGL